MASTCCVAQTRVEAPAMSVMSIAHDGRGGRLVGRGAQKRGSQPPTCDRNHCCFFCAVVQVRRFVASYVRISRTPRHSPAGRDTRVWVGVVPVRPCRPEPLPPTGDTRPPPPGGGRSCAFDRRACSPESIVSPGVLRVGSGWGGARTSRTWCSSSGGRSWRRWWTRAAPSSCTAGVTAASAMSTAHCSRSTRGRASWRCRCPRPPLATTPRAPRCATTPPGCASQRRAPVPSASCPYLSQEAEGIAAASHVFDPPADYVLRPDDQASRPRPPPRMPDPPDGPSSSSGDLRLRAQAHDPRFRRGLSRHRAGVAACAGSFALGSAPVPRETLSTEGGSAPVWSAVDRAAVGAGAAIKDPSATRPLFPPPPRVALRRAASKAPKAPLGSGDPPVRGGFGAEGPVN
eukprot:1180945-Prorocentrum_minimum.AAC.4